MDEVASSDSGPNWKSTKLWYSVVLQVLATCLLLRGSLSGDQWIWVTSMIYGGYILGNLGALAIGVNNFQKKA